MRIGPLLLSNRLVLAPMAGITDLPFRLLCRRLGAGLAVSEMVSAAPGLRHTPKSRRRLDHQGEPAPRAVQIAGANPALMAEAACHNVDAGAQIIDINMGCPAKKVCRVQAGSALLGDEALVARMLDAVVNAVSVPVTLKIRTGLDPANRNAVRIARLAEQAGIAAITVHGRSRACAFRGVAEYNTIRAVKSAVGIPVIANGDIDSGEKAQAVLLHTGADGVMIGRAALGNPWVFREVEAFLRTGRAAPGCEADEVRDTLLEHLDGLYRLYGTRTGARVARKHLGWYCKGKPDGSEFWQRINRVEECEEQLRITKEFLDRSIAKTSLAA
jgi:tRNA-dihydrouridine synthase B